ncbi:MAG: D-alanyl-D-alanine carboxypeptidase, partial [Cyanobacteria bacterium J06635_15]
DTLDCRSSRLTSFPRSGLSLVDTQRFQNSFSVDILAVAVDGLHQLGKCILQELGVDPESYVQVDGSGLSRHNLTTPTALVSVLQAMDQMPNAAVYRNSLSQAGINGTLRNSFRNSAIEEQLWGKSGWLSRNAALSGYVNPPNYPPLVFSILLNNADTRSSVIGRAMDDVVLLLADLHICGD